MDLFIIEYKMETDYHKSCKSRNIVERVNKSSAFLQVQKPVYVRSYFKEDRTATILLNKGESSLSYTHHVNPHFRIPKYKK